jgi:hypothetical protein
MPRPRLTNRDTHTIAYREARERVETKKGGKGASPIAHREKGDEEGFKGSDLKMETLKIIMISIPILPHHHNTLAHLWQSLVLCESCCDHSADR